MTKKRIPIEIKPCCHNCRWYGADDCKNFLDKRNPCHDWSPDGAWFTSKLATATRKLNKQQKEKK